MWRPRGSRRLLFSHCSLGARVPCGGSGCSENDQPPCVYFNPRPTSSTFQIVYQPPCWALPPARSGGASKWASPTRSWRFSPAKRFVVQPSWCHRWQFHSSHCLGQKSAVNLVLPSCCTSAAPRNPVRCSGPTTLPCHYNTGVSNSSLSPGLCNSLVAGLGASIRAPLGFILDTATRVSFKCQIAASLDSVAPYFTPSRSHVPRTNTHRHWLPYSPRVLCLVYWSLLCSSPRASWPSVVLPKIPSCPAPLPLLRHPTLTSVPPHTALITLWQSGAAQYELLFNEHLPPPECRCHTRGHLCFSRLLYLKCQQECLAHSRRTFNICWMNAHLHVIMRARKDANNSISTHKHIYLLTEPTLVFPSPTGKHGSTFSWWLTHLTHRSKPYLPC